MRVWFAVLLAVGFAAQACTTTGNSGGSKEAEHKSGSKSESGGFMDKMEKKAEGAEQKIKDKVESHKAKSGDKKSGDKNSASAKDDATVSACKTEVEKYCKAVEHDFNKMFKCLKDNQKKLGPPCKAAVTAFRKAHK